MASAPLKEQTLPDAIVAYLISHPEGVTAETIAQQFLKLTRPTGEMARRLVSAVLRDSGCECDTEGRWFCAPQSEKSELLDRIPWVSVYLDADKVDSNVAPSIGVWSLFPRPECLWAGMVPDRTRYRSIDAGMSIKTDGISRIALDVSALEALLDGKAAVYFSFSQYQRLAGLFAAHNFDQNDDCLFMCQLFRACGFESGLSENLDDCFRALFGDLPPPMAVSDTAARFGMCVGELLRRCVRAGADTRLKIDEKDRLARQSFRWPNLQTTYETICAFPESPGVYGFKNGNGTFLRIGRARNLKKRLEIIFGIYGAEAGASGSLYRDAHEIVVYECGSLLESRILEYRLIKKHLPVREGVLGNRTEAAETLQACTVVLPSARLGRCTMLWYSTHRRLVLKTIDPEDDAAEEIIRTLALSFFVRKDEQSAPLDADPVESDIVATWITAYRRECHIFSPGPIIELSAIVRDLRSLCRSVSHPRLIP